MKPPSLHLPAPELQLRAQVLLSGSLAAEVQAEAERYQTTPAAEIRRLVVDGLQARRRMKETA